MRHNTFRVRTLPDNFADIVLTASNKTRRDWWNANQICPACKADISRALEKDIEKHYWSNCSV